MYLKFNPENFRELEGRVPPQSIEMEEQVLGGVLLDPKSLDRVTDLLQPESFYVSSHAQIFRAMLSLSALEQSPDLFAVCEYLQSRNLLEDVGGRTRLIELFDQTISSVSIDQYAKVVAECFNRRRLIQAAQEMVVMAFNRSKPWSEAIESAQSKIFSLSSGSQRKDFQALGDVVQAEYNRAERLYSNPDERPGIKSGFYDLDGMVQGFKPGDLVIVAGRPSMGKSAIAGAIALNAAYTGKPVALFSLEMSAGKIARRFMASEAGIDSGRIGSGQITESEWMPLMGTLQTLQVPVLLSDDRSITPTSVLERCRLLKAKQGLSMVVIDYLHLMLSDPDDEVKAIGRITRACKIMAGELDVPVILLSQLSRSCESRTNKRPMMSDLRASGSIEQDADVILLLYRDEYYNPDTPDRGVAEIIVAKNRDGAVGTVKLLFEPQFTRFRNLSRYG